MEWIINEGRVGKADPAFPWPAPIKAPVDEWNTFSKLDEYNKAIESCLSHATWFDESENERALELMVRQKTGTGYYPTPYSVWRENFPDVEEVANIVDPCPICNANAREQSQKGCPEITCYKGRPEYKRTVLRFKQEPNKAEVVADFGKECYLRGLKDGVESVKHEPKEEPNPSTSFFKFVQNQHPDPDHLMSKSVESAWPEICKLADKYREEPKTGESQAEVRDTLIDFVNWFSKLKPSDKCTVHPPAGSGGSTGLYNLTNAAIVDKFLTRKQTNNKPTTYEERDCKKDIG